HAVLTDIHRGRQDKVHEAGAVIVGGHTIIDEELKYGLAVTGRVDPRRMLTNAGAREGDVLILTKPLGTGILATARKNGSLGDAEHNVMLATMTALNATASKAAVGLGALCATDVTGFGLLGHASHIAKASRVTLAIGVRDIPILAGARAAWAHGARTGGADRNSAYLLALVEWGAVSDEDRALVVDPQTSGGLLVALPAVLAQDYLSRVPGAVVIGEVRSRASHEIILT
ncbi:MAG: selenide, water dikinase SelD, partial [Gemmatimonadaceae bacterium]|nr:selenide, water dikinase SelD [Gemmatimonadaceae bacterium]